MTLMIQSWCPGSKCDPCKTGNLELYGNEGYPPDKIAACVVGGYIISYPEFPVAVTATISLQGLYRPFVGPILSAGGGSVTISGTSNGFRVPCPFPSTFFRAPLGWNPSAYADQLLFEVAVTSTTTSGATLDIPTVTALFHTDLGTVYDVWGSIRWTGNVG